MGSTCLLLLCYYVVLFGQGESDELGLLCIRVLRWRYFYVLSLCGVEPMSDSPEICEDCSEAHEADELCVTTWDADPPSFYRGGYSGYER